MDFAFSEEQEQLRSWARQFLTERYDADRLARIADSAEGGDPQVWPHLVEMGWLDAELGFVDHAVLFEEAGAALLPAPYFSTVALAAPAVRHGGSLDSLDSLDGAAQDGGARPATLAWAEPGVPQGLLDTEGVAARVRDGAADGRKVLVPDAGAAELLVILARGPDGLGLYGVDASDAVIEPQPTVDGTRRLGDVRLSGSPARTLVGPDEVASVLDTIRQRSLAAVACEAVGVARRALELARDHARTREQFGRPIGVYQGVAHQLADVYVALERARSLAYWSAWSVAEGDRQAPRACLAAKSLAAQAAVDACERAIQVHGGIGMTWEHELHRYLKRAQWLAAFEGDAREQRAEIAASLLD